MPPPPPRHPRSRTRLVLVSLLPTFTLLAMAAFCVLFFASGAYGTLLEGLRERFGHHILVGLAVIPLLLFGMLTFIYPAYWIEVHLLPDRDSDHPLWWPGTLRDLAVDWFFSVLILYAISFLIAVLPFGWWLVCGIAAGCYTGIQHRIGFHGLLKRAAHLDPLDDPPLTRALAEPLQTLNAHIGSLATWEETEFELPIPYPGLVVAGSPRHLHVFLPARSAHTTKTPDLAADIVHAIAHHLELNARRNGLLHPFFPTPHHDPAAPAPPFPNPPAPPADPAHLARLPLLVAAICLLMPPLQTAANLVTRRWILHADRSAARALGDPAAIARRIRFHRHHEATPAVLPAWLEAITRTLPLPATRIRALRKPHT